VSSNGSPELPTDSRGVGLLVSNFGTIMNLPMPLCTSTRHILSGPTIHYEGQRWFATLGFLRQLPIGQAFSHENKEFAAHDSYILGDEHEKYYVRLRVGFDF
jgi:hypothetical protein